MNRVQRNLIVGVLIGLGLTGASGANALDWSETPQIVGTIIGSGVGGVIGSISANPFIAGAAGAAGGIAGGKVGPYVAENPQKSAQVFGVVASGPQGMISAGYKFGVSKALNFAKNLFS